MLQSMTGYGKADTTIKGIKYQIDIKSLNSKGLDLNIRFPQWLRSHEPEIRKLVSDQLQRGKIDAYINSEIITDEADVKLNKPLILAYMNQMELIAPEVSKEKRLELAMQLPDILKSDQDELNEEDLSKFLQAVEEALERIQTYRTDEGKALQTELNQRTVNIQNLLNSVLEFEDERMIKIREKMTKSLEEITQVDQDRLEQELIFYLEKLDITEEKVRLANHCNYFLETMNSTEANGKKLGFIAQEMGREINTLGSKANHTEIQKLVIQMKDELEKIKEQVLNIL